MKHLFIFIVVILTVYAAEAREIALTFDDCPRKPGPVLDPIQRDLKILSALKDARITAAFFCNSPTREVKGLERLKNFAKHGHLIANHTADHPDINKISIADFVKNIDKADRELKTLPNFRKWFRYPFLHEGKNSQDVEAVRLFLKKGGYINGYVTIDTEDWYVDEVLRKKVLLGKRYDENLLCQTYARMMTDEGDLFDEMSIKALGRSVKHIILLHETDLNAICLTKLIQAFKNKQWSFISPDVAYKDPISLKEPKSSTKLNGGRVFALAKESGYNGPYYSRWIKESEIEKELQSQGVWK
jgi:peptidoglycan/xylan/chitin deacetylase (PgdA/CDA1 family)